MDDLTDDLTLQAAATGLINYMGANVPTPIYMDEEYAGIVGKQCIKCLKELTEE